MVGQLRDPEVPFGVRGITRGSREALGGQGEEFGALRGPGEDLGGSNGALRAAGDDGTCRRGYNKLNGAAWHHGS